MKKTDAPVRLMQISAPISPPLAAAQHNPYRDIGVGRPPPGRGARGKKPTGQRPRQEQHEVCGLFHAGILSALCVSEVGQVRGLCEALVTEKADAVEPRSVYHFSGIRYLVALAIYLLPLSWL